MERKNKKTLLRVFLFFQQTLTLLASTYIDSGIGNHFDVAVVGSGLSGLVSAKLLKAAGVHTVVLEADNRVGGRTFSSDGADLGACWSWPSNDKMLSDLLNELQLATLLEESLGVSIMQQEDGSIKFGPNLGPGNFYCLHCHASQCLV